MLQEQLLAVLESSSNYLNQNDLLALSQVSKQLHDRIAIRKLYASIHITRDPVIRSQIWYLDGGKSYLSGYRATKKTQDQNDLFLYDRIERLSNSRHLQLVEELSVDDDMFGDREFCVPILEKLLDRLIELNKLKKIELRDSELFEIYHSRILKMESLNKITVINIESLNSIGAISGLRKLKWFLLNPEANTNALDPPTRKIMTSKLKEVEFIADEIQCCSLNLFQYLQRQKIRLDALRFLKFNYTHNIDGYDKAPMEDPVTLVSSVIDLNRLEKLELGISCEYYDCDCMEIFMNALAPGLISLRELSLIEKNTTEITNHQAKERWDIAVCRFIMQLPSVGHNLKSLSIRHATPFNGMSQDSLPGNYARRRALYDIVLPKLSSLQKLIAPNILQCLSAYEYLMCDLLWNGCECQSCQSLLPIFDQYLMNHQYYLTREGRYADITPTVFFAYAGNFLTSRFSNEVDWDLNILSVAPLQRFWNLHGFGDIHHFKDYECLFDETTSPPLGLIISHFFNGYMDHLVQLLPNLKTVLLSGIYYTVDASHNYRSIYD